MDRRSFSGPQRHFDGDRGRVIERKTLWGPETRYLGKITGILTPEQLNAYALHTAITDLSERLRTNTIVINERSRSVSPPPEYDSYGKRINTREQRCREKMEKELTALVDLALRTIPHFRAPVNFKRYQKTQEKIFMPVKEYPNINFVGLLLGPRGKTLQRMEQDSGAKIAIRGRGSVKEGRGRNQSSQNGEEQEDLHCIVNADSAESLERGIKMVHNIINTAISMPEHHNELKRGQLRELAVLNGTLRDDEHQICSNCGQGGHRKFACPQRSSFLSSVICHNCNKSGHFARDCTTSMDPTGAEAAADFDKFIQEIRGEDSDLPHKKRTRSSSPPLGAPGTPKPSNAIKAMQSAQNLPPGVTALPPGVDLVQPPATALPPPPPALKLNSAGRAPLPPKSTPPPGLPPGNIPAPPPPVQMPKPPAPLGPPGAPRPPGTSVQQNRQAPPPPPPPGV